jgi:hypothetical protein
MFSVGRPGKAMQPRLATIAANNLNHLRPKASRKPKDQSTAEAQATFITTVLPVGEFQGSGSGST